MSNKVLIVGADGQLAYDLNRVFKETGSQIIEARKADFDVSDYDTAHKYITDKSPDIVINTAAFHKVGLCEQDPSTSFKVNSIGAANISKIASEVGAISVFISTNYVFDGLKGGRSLYVEMDCPKPVNVYGVSKLAGEQLVQAYNRKSYIVRTSGLFGVRRSGKGHNFVTLMLEKAGKGEDISVVNDETTSVTSTHDLAVKINELLSKKVPFGVYHLVNDGACTWYEFAREIFQLSKKTVSLKPISLSERPPEGFTRPVFSAMDSDSLKVTGVSKMRSWKLALADFLKEYEYNS